MYFKIKALAETGAKIILHYFDYKSGRGTETIEQYCEEIHAYSRKSFFQAPTFSKPHIVASRINQQLINRLNADGYPILLEGIHCTGIISYLKNQQRKIMVRLHNDEAAYYRQLAKKETAFFKTPYYAIESLLLKRYQYKLSDDIAYAAISEKDATVFRTKYGLKNVFYLPAFVPWDDVESLTGKGNYCLYHGNLSVAENEAAATWLIEKVFAKFPIPLFIAGKNGSSRLAKAVQRHPHIKLVLNPAHNELETLIREAHVHVLPDFNNTGVKLKLLHALFCGRFCITNNQEMTNSNTVGYAQTPQEYMGFLKSFMTQSFTDAHAEERRMLLQRYDNKANANILNARL